MNDSLRFPLCYRYTPLISNRRRSFLSRPVARASPGGPKRGCQEVCRQVTYPNHIIRQDMRYSEDTPFYQLLATKYDAAREQEALAILEKAPEIARLEWPGPDRRGQPFVKGSTALHYAANDGKLGLGAFVGSQQCTHRNHQSSAGPGRQAGFSRRLTCGRLGRLRLWPGKRTRLRRVAQAPGRGRGRYQ